MFGFRDVELNMFGDVGFDVVARKTILGTIGVEIANTGGRLEGCESALFFLWIY